MVIIAEEHPSEILAIATVLRCVTDAAYDIGHTDLVGVIDQQRSEWGERVEAGHELQASPFLVAASEAWADGMDTQRMLEGVQFSPLERAKELEAASEEILRRIQAAPDLSRPLLRVVIDEATFNQLQPAFQRLGSREKNELRRRMFNYLATF